MSSGATGAALGRRVSQAGLLRRAAAVSSQGSRLGLQEVPARPLNEVLSRLPELVPLSFRSYSSDEFGEADSDGLQFGEANSDGVPDKDALTGPGLAARLARMEEQLKHEEKLARLQERQEHQKMGMEDLSKMMGRLQMTLDSVVAGTTPYQQAQSQKMEAASQKMEVASQKMEQKMEAASQKMEQKMEVASQKMDQKVDKMNSNVESLLRSRTQAYAVGAFVLVTGTLLSSWWKLVH